MANSKHTPSTLAAGLGMGMAFLKILAERIDAQGGYEEMIHFLTTERGLPTMDKLAKLIVNSEWRIPRSLIERLVVEESRRQNAEEHVLFDRYFFWTQIGLEERFGISVSRFNQFGEMPIPEEIITQIVGKTLRCPLVVTWNEEPHVVVYVETDHEEEWNVGNVIEIPPDAIGLAAEKYFDLTR